MIELTQLTPVQEMLINTSPFYMQFIVFCCILLTFTMIYTMYIIRPLSESLFLQLHCLFFHMHLL